MQERASSRELHGTPRGSSAQQRDRSREHHEAGRSSSNHDDGGEDRGRTSGAPTAKPIVSEQQKVVPQQQPMSLGGWASGLLSDAVKPKVASARNNEKLEALRARFLKKESSTSEEQQPGNKAEGGGKK